MSENILFDLLIIRSTQPDDKLFNCLYEFLSELRERSPQGSPNKPIDHLNLKCGDPSRGLDLHCNDFNGVETGLEVLA
jgi:hypothetical protein